MPAQTASVPGVVAIAIVQSAALRPTVTAGDGAGDVGAAPRRPPISDEGLVAPQRLGQPTHAGSPRRMSRTGGRRVRVAHHVDRPAAARLHVDRIPGDPVRGVMRGQHGDVGDGVGIHEPGGRDADLHEQPALQPDAAVAARHHATGVVARVAAEQRPIPLALEQVGADLVAVAVDVDDAHVRSA